MNKTILSLLLVLVVGMGLAYTVRADDTKVSDDTKMAGDTLRMDSVTGEPTVDLNPLFWESFRGTANEEKVIVKHFGPLASIEEIDANGNREDFIEVGQTRVVDSDELSGYMDEVVYDNNDGTIITEFTDASGPEELPTRNLSDQSWAKIFSERTKKMTSD